MDCKNCRMTMFWDDILMVYECPDCGNTYDFLEHC